MIKPKFDYSKYDYPHDVERIVKVLVSAGYIVTPQEAENMWHKYSDSYAAIWLFLPNDDEELLRCLESII